MKIKRILKAISLTLASVVLMCTLVSCGDKGSETYDSSKSSVSASGNYEGKFTMTLYEDVAPITTANFEKLVKNGFYNGLTFHRIVSGFMAQGGDPDGTGYGGNGETIKGEFSANGVTNTLSHTRGVVSMARSQSNDSASTQFFICYSNNYAKTLDGNYAAFGKVTEGMDVVDKFTQTELVQTNENKATSPVNPITILSAKMISNDSDGNPRVEFTVKLTLND